MVLKYHHIENKHTAIKYVQPTITVSFPDGGHFILRQQGEDKRFEKYLLP